MSSGEPPFTKVPNEILDNVLPHLRGGEVQALLVIVRETIGYHRSSCTITYDDFQEKSGLSRPAIARALRGLKKRGVIACEGNTYSITYGSSNVSLLSSNETLLSCKNDNNETLPETVTNVNCDSNECEPNPVTIVNQNTRVLKKEKKDLKKEKKKDFSFSRNGDSPNPNSHDPPPAHWQYAWDAAVEENRMQLARGASNWLTHANLLRVLEDDPESPILVLGVTHAAALDAIQGRMTKWLERTIGSIARRKVRIEFQLEAT